MHQQNQTYQKHYDGRPPYGQPTSTGLPVSSTADGNQFYSSDNSYSHSVGGLHLQSKARVPWSTGLCDCTSDFKNCCITCWCPCVTFGQVAEIVDQGSTSCVASGALYTLIFCVAGCACFYSCLYRSKIRHQYMLVERPCGDCLVHCFCEACALCQEYRELKNRGFDMGIGVGWHGNVEQRNRGAAMSIPAAPTVESGMSR